MVDFSLKRITQSDYRGGSSKGHRDGTAGRINLELEPLNLSVDMKVKCRALIANKAELLLTALLPEHKRQQVRDSDYLKSIYEKLDV